MLFILTIYRNLDVTYQLAMHYLQIFTGLLTIQGQDVELSNREHR